MAEEDRSGHGPGARKETDPPASVPPPLVESPVLSTIGKRVYDDPQSDTTLYRVPFLNAAFAVSSLVLLVLTVWAIWQDYDREWKDYNYEWQSYQAEQYRSQLDAEQAKQLGPDFGVKAFNGTGPYCFESWTPRDQTVLVKHARYAWGPPIYKNAAAQVDRVVLEGLATHGDSDRTAEEIGVRELFTRALVPVVEQHGGELRYESEVGCGTTVTVSLPAGTGRLGVPSGA